MNLTNILIDQMNPSENIEKIFSLNKTKFVEAGDEHLFPTYNPNTYLKLDFNTLDNLDLLDMSKSRFNIVNRVIESDEDYDLIVGSETCTNVIYEKLGYMPLSYGYHGNDLGNYTSTINTILMTANNIIEKSRQDLGNTPEQMEIEQNIKNHFKVLEDQKIYIRKVINANDKLIKDSGFYVGNDASFDEEEKSIFFNRIKNHLINNKEYLSHGLNDRLNQLPESVVESIVGIKHETYKLIALAKDLGVHSMYSSLADQYKDLNVSESPITSFVTDKMIADDAKTSLTFNKNNTNTKVYLMNDSSLLYITKNGEMNTVKNHQEYKALLTSITKDLISELLPNKPKIVNFFNSIALEEGLEFKTIQHLLNTVNTFINNQDILKNIGLNILAIKDKSLEVIDDYLNAESKSYKAKNFSKNILSNKYKHLETQESDVYFKELYDKELSEKDLQNYIGKKLAALKEPEDLVKLLKNVFQQLDGFTNENLNRKLDKFGIKPFYDKYNIVVFKIDNYDQCKDLGSPSWCIHRQESYFKTYTNNGCQQFIIYDFEKDSKDTYSIIGFTIHANGTLRTQHLKNDDYVGFSNPASSYLSEIHMKAVEAYITKENMNESLSAIIYPPKPENDVGLQTETQIKKSTKMSNGPL